MLLFFSSLLPVGVGMVLVATTSPDPPVQAAGTESGSEPQAPSVETEPRRPPEPPVVKRDARVAFSVASKLVVFTPSDYSRTLRIFDRVGLIVGGGLTSQLYAVIRPWFQLGGQVGWMHADSWATSMSLADSFRVTPTVAYDIADLSGSMRFVGHPKGPHQPFRLDAGLECGFAVGSATLTGIGQRILAPRLDASFGLGWEDRAPGFLFVARLGYQYIPWGASGAGAGDPVFSGVYFTLDMGGVL